MKKNILKSLLAGACIVALASCDDNSWNDEHLNGFDGNPAITDVQSIEYTLTAADYASIAANADNKAAAEAAGVANELKAVGTQHYFTDVITAKDYIPAFLGSNKFAQFVLDNGSAVKATYNVAVGLPEEVSAVAAAEQYTISKENYQAVWESNKNFVESFTPAKPASEAIPEILKAQYPDAAAGQYAIVTYNTATSEPEFTTKTAAAKTAVMSRAADADLTSTIGSAVKGETCEAKGIVTAICAQGYILTDNSGSILVYHGKTYDKSHTVGDVIKISATVGSYNKGLQLTGSGATESKEGTKPYTYPAPMKMTGADMDALLTSRVNDELAVYAQFVGTPSVGNYINITVDGASTAMGSVYQATDEQKALFTDGEEALISGYFITVSSGKYVNFVITKVEDPNAAASDADLTSVLGSVALDQTYDVKGVVTAICKQGYILTDNTGSILVYYGKNYAATHKVGDVVKINAPVGSYGTALQLTGSKATEEIVGTKEVAYPEPVVMTGADMDAAATRTDNELAIYAQFQGTPVISGNYVNINVEGATASQGSIYQATDEQKALFTDGEEVVITGYFVSVSSGKYVNFIPTSVAPVIYDGVVIPSVKENAVYCFDGSKWTVPADMSILNPADYTAMGQKYGNLSKDAKPEEYLPLYLKNKFPYAQAEETEFIVYNYYDGSNFIRCDQYVYDGTAWAANTGVATETAQFVKSEGKWMYDPNVTITLPAGKGQELSTLYYQACTDWVFENIDKPLGSTDKKSGKFYVTSYGNNEYYSGTSAYQGNVDLRPSAARTQYPTEYADMADDAIVALMKARFANEVMPGALAMLHPDAAPVPGLEVIYTINFAVYTGSTAEYTIRYEVTAPGKFEFIDCTWVAAE